MATRHRATPPTDAPAADAPRPLVPVIPEDVRAFLGDPPLTVLEDPRAYEDQLARIAGAVAPKDAIEWLWVRDVCDLVWESRRLRMAKVEVVRLSMVEALDDVLLDPGQRTLKALLRADPNSSDEDGLALAWLAGDADARAELEEQLMARGRTLATVEAQAHLLRLNALERLDRLIAIGDGRRDAILRDLERRRAAVAARLRAVAETLIDEPAP
ncbi:hypothetical protein [Azospirillum sp. sgz301742]